MSPPSTSDLGSLTIWVGSAPYNFTVSLCLVIAMRSDPLNKYLGVGSSANANSLLPAMILRDFEEVVLCLILLILCRIVLKQVPFPCNKYRK